MTDRSTNRVPSRPHHDSSAAQQEAVEGTTSTDSADHDPDREYLGKLPDGSGCTEIWEHLSELRRADD